VHKAGLSFVWRRLPLLLLALLLPELRLGSPLILCVCVSPSFSLPQVSYCAALRRRRQSLRLGLPAAPASLSLSLCLPPSERATTATTVTTTNIQMHTRDTTFGLLLLCCDTSAGLPLLQQQRFVPF